VANVRVTNTGAALRPRHTVAIRLPTTLCIATSQCIVIVNLHAVGRVIRDAVFVRQVVGYARIGHWAYIDRICQISREKLAAVVVPGAITNSVTRVYHSTVITLVG
jgi:hypothetical protein